MMILGKCPEVYAPVKVPVWSWLTVLVALSCSLIAGPQPTAVNVPAPVRYFGLAEGGVSHFHYWRDNSLLAWMHARLLAGFLPRLPRLVLRRLRSFRH